VLLEDLPLAVRRPGARRGAGTPVSMKGLTGRFRSKASIGVGVCVLSAQITYWVFIGKQFTSKSDFLF
jgi:hypothetical protein